MIMGGKGGVEKLLPIAITSHLDRPTMSRRVAEKAVQERTGGAGVSAPGGAQR
jgi:hypothetical protein